MATTYLARLGRVTFNGSGNSTMDGTSGVISSLLLGASYGTLLQQVIIKSNTTPATYGMIRFWIQEGGAGVNDWNLIKEVEVQVVTIVASGDYPSFYRVVTFGNLMIPPNATLGVTTETNDLFQITALGMDITGWI